MHMLRGNKQIVKNDQRGMAAMVVVTVLMFVISVIVLGFAQVVRREQRNALDNQLATQAYYAAESGLNLAQKKVQDVLAGPTDPTEKTSCTEEQGYSGINDELVIGENAEITCVLIDPTPSELKYQNIQHMHSVPFLVKSAGDEISNIYVSWESSTSSDVNADCDGAGTFEPTTAAWSCPQPLLRVDLVPVTGENMNSDAVANSQFTAFLSPRRNGAPTSIGYSQSVNNIPAVRCTSTPGPADSETPLSCTAKITGLSNLLGPGGYALRVMSLYRTSNITVFATNSTSNDRLQLVGGQVVVDVTAKAADVLKRLQARMPVSGGESFPNFAITSGGGVCKRYQISGGVPSIDGDAEIREACRL